MTALKAVVTGLPSLGDMVRDLRPVPDMASLAHC